MKQFSLEKVLEYRRHVRQERRSDLATALAVEQALISERADVENQRSGQLQELAALSRSESLDVDGAARRRYFTTQLDIQLLVIEQQMEPARIRVEAKRNELVRADQDVKALEKLRAGHFSTEQYAENRRTEHALAEQWQSTNWSW